MKLLNFILLFVAGCGIMSGAERVTWVSTTDADRWHTENAPRITAFDKDKVNDIIVTRYTQQTIDGFGTCLNELGWDALNLLSPDKKQELMHELFDPADGLCLNYCRLTIGANDYSRNWFSYDETDGDFDMKDFDISRDFQAHIPYIKAVMKINPGLRLWASPWSPPTWMKTNRHYATTTGSHNDLTPENQVLNGDQFIQDPRYLEAYALYLSKFITAYAREGIKVGMLQFQNEPYTRNQWPTCLWTPEAMRNFITSYLGPKFAAEHPEVELWLGTINCNRIEDVTTVMNDPQTRRYVKGIGLQWEGKEIVGQVSELYPDLKLMQTENECGSGTFDWAAAEHTFDLIKTYFDGGVSSYMYWNAVLSDKGTSSWGWNQNAMVVIDSSTRSVTFTPEYYLMKHLSHYVRPGATKMKTLGRDNTMLAFRNPDGSSVLFIANKDEKPREISVGINGKVLTFTLKAKSFNTITLTN